LPVAIGRLPESGKQSTARFPKKRIDRRQEEAKSRGIALFRPSPGACGSRRLERPRLSEVKAERFSPRKIPSPNKGHTMTMLKVVEVLAESEQSWEQAAQHAVTTAAKTVRNIRSIHIDNFEGQVKDGKIIQYRINGKISFALEE
jgi:flavin-binding protein dodecin